MKLKLAIHIILIKPTAVKRWYQQMEFVYLKHRYWTLCVTITVILGLNWAVHSTFVCYSPSWTYRFSQRKYPVCYLCHSNGDLSRKNRWCTLFLCHSHETHNIGMMRRSLARASNLSMPSASMPRWHHYCLVHNIYGTIGFRGSVSVASHRMYSNMGKWDSNMEIFWSISKMANLCRLGKDWEGVGKVQKMFQQKTLQRQVMVGRSLHGGLAR